MKKLYLKCKTCGEKFQAGIQMDEESFMTVTLQNNNESCPKGHVNSYNKEDYFFEEEE